MGNFDLYGNSYPTAREALNAVAITYKNMSSGAYVKIKPMNVSLIK